ncbi:MAG: hypothetical protein Q9167_004904 [Letrouitia subvulpina]
MAYVQSDHLGWHEGEQAMHEMLHVPTHENPTVPFLSPFGTRFLPSAPLIAIGTLDSNGRPWTNVIGGEPGIARPLGSSNIGIRTLVDPEFDPVVNILLSHQDQIEARPASTKKIVSALSIDLAARNRLKLAGTIKVIAVEQLGSDSDGAEAKAAEAQMVIKIDQSLGNCPKYLNKKNITPVIPEPSLASDSLPLPNEAVRLLDKADLFFISSSYHHSYMGTNDRGGPKGFVRIFQNDTSETVLVYPEYSGNRLYQTLGNLQTTPQAGLVFPDFETGDVLYVTGTTEIVVGKKAAAILPRSNLAVKIHVSSARFVYKGLAFRGQDGEPSPYNPPVRFLATERFPMDAQAVSDKVAYAKLIQKDILAPSIARFRFSISDPEAAGRWSPGQYVALAFEEELGLGYSHMRDDDPASLNDDLTRTFTVSSHKGGELPEDEFEVTIRNVGKVTSFLFKQQVRSGLEIPLRGFGGSFVVKQSSGEITPFVAGGVGITPLLSQLNDLHVPDIRLFWTVHRRDLGLVLDSFMRRPDLAYVTRVFITGLGTDAEPSTGIDMLQKIKVSGATVLARRMDRQDIILELQSQPNLSQNCWLLGDQWIPHPVAIESPSSSPEWLKFDGKKNNSQADTNLTIDYWATDSIAKIENDSITDKEKYGLATQSTVDLGNPASTLFYCRGPLEHRYDHLRPIDSENPRFYFALDLYQAGEVLPRLLASILEVVKYLGPENCYVSIVEGRSNDDTLELLNELRVEAQKLDLAYTLIRSDTNPKAEGGNRIEGLAKLRNLALAPLYNDPSQFDIEQTVIIFINDIIACANDILELFHQYHMQEADMVCSMDYLRGLFYDSWISRSMTGDLYIEIPPSGWSRDRARDLFWDDAVAKSRLLAYQPLQVFSCWNGMAVIRARPFIENGIRFRRNRESECYTGEPLLLCKDLWANGYWKILVVPSVWVAYNRIESFEVKLLQGFVEDHVGSNDSNPEVQEMIEWRARPPARIKCTEPLWSDPRWELPFEGFLDTIENNMTR